MSVVSAIIYVIIAAVAAGIVVAYWYERKLRRDAYSANEQLSARLEQTDRERRSMQLELARLEGVSQGRQCDAMQREFLESLQNNGQGIVQIRRRHQQ